MKNIQLRPAEPERDFKQLAAWFSSFEDEPTTESGLHEWYEKVKQNTIPVVAEDEQAELFGFFWALRDKTVPDRWYFDLFVRPDQRGKGIGRQMYKYLLQTLAKKRAQILETRIRDTWLGGLAFFERRGFREVRHRIMMTLNLDSFDDRPYDAIIANLKREDFQFTSMEELGNTEDAQRKLYHLNETTSMETLGASGEPSWDSFEDFRESVCQSEWYKSAGQKVVIDTTTGIWAAMSAITCIEGNTYAYNLHTGVDKRYRGRKLGQAVKVTALRYAREVLKAHEVRTHHNTKNLPMIAIDEKLGYTRLPGTILMEKELK
jgi:GNAT superfamily N-acetyltransferase